ncbi:hypothetical protein ACCT19_36855, partial [Rhizobium ruizarguesonis]
TRGGGPERNPAAARLSEVLGNVTFLLRHDVTEVAFPLHPTRASLLDPFFNINTPDDLVEAERWLEALRA